MINLLDAVLIQHSCLLREISSILLWWCVIYRVLNWKTSDGLLFVVDNTLFVNHNINKTHSHIDFINFSVNICTIHIVVFILIASMEHPKIRMPTTNFTLTAGISFPNIPLFIGQPHFPLTFTPSLPSSVHVIANNSSQGAGYILTGMFPTPGNFEYVISAGNYRGSDSIHLFVNVEGIYLFNRNKS